MTISKSRELIPLNNELTNFQADFNITSKNKKPFRALIVNQDLLDGDDDSLEMKTAPKGVFAGKIIQNSGKHDDWYIALEADEEMEAIVSVNTEEVEEDQSKENYARSESGIKKKKKMPMWLIALIISLVLGIGYVLYRFVFKRKSKVITAVAPAQLPLPITPERELTPPPRPNEEPKKDLNLDFSELPSI